MTTKGSFGGKKGKTPLYTVEVFSGFSSAHRLRGYKGKCERMHGHNWKVGVTVSGSRLDKTGIVMDFKYLKNTLRKILAGLDHKDINSLHYFKTVNPTSENIAEYIFKRLKRIKIPVSNVSVWEGEDSKATYTEV